MYEFITSPQTVAFLLVIGAGMAAIGKGFMVFLKYIDAKAAVHIKAEADARQELVSEFKNRIEALEGAVKNMEAQEGVYIRRIYQLESFIQGINVKVPVMEGWPPK